MSGRRLDPGGGAAPAQAEPLSQREVECLRMAATGLTDCSAAQAMGIKRSTVRFHLHNACRKLGATNRSAAIYRAAKINCI